MFYALDVETANPSISSICQVGIAKFIDGFVVEKYIELVNPEQYFDPFNTEIHGIDNNRVKNALKFPSIYKYLKSNLDGQIVVHHTPFDKSAINAVCKKYGLAQLNITWLDSAKIVRRAWPELKERGYGLSNICNKLNISFKHHDALEDAIAAGKVVNCAVEKTGINIDDWLIAVNNKIGSPKSANKKKQSVKMDGNSEGPLYGETVVFTGTLSIPRRDAAQIASTAGCNVVDNMNKKCTILVLGQQDLYRLAGKDKSAKQLQAEKFIKEGCSIKIISEDDFMQICDL